MFNCSYTVGSLGQAVIVHMSCSFKRPSQIILGPSRQAGYAEGRPAQCMYREKRPAGQAASGQWPMATKQRSLRSRQAGGYLQEGI